jgi:hypothetical protein
MSEVDPLASLGPKERKLVQECTSNAARNWFIILLITGVGLAVAYCGVILFVPNYVLRLEDIKNWLFIALAIHHCAFRLGVARLLRKVFPRNGVGPEKRSPG